MKIQYRYSRCRLIYNPRHKDATLCSLNTDVEHRGKSYAKYVLLAVKKFAKKMGIKEVRLTCAPYGQNPPDFYRLLNYYKKQGFYLNEDINGNTPSYGCVLVYRTNGVKP